MIPAAPATERRSTRPWRRLARLDGFTASAAYLALAVVMTWPVAATLTTRLPNDLGDPLFACWLLDWNLDHFVALAGGHLDAFASYWNAGIFYPEPLALLYSEHLFALAVQALPIWLVTRDVVLCYNLLFLSTFVLSGLGTFLLVRELTGNARAAFVAGLFYAFTPYRFAQLGHIQVLSSQWMPFVLFGLRRFFVAREEARSPGDGALPASRHPALTRRQALPLAGAAVALVAQNLSCGYFMMFFAPVVAACVLWEIGTRGWWRDARMWAALTTTGAAVAAACLPFLLKYQALRQRGFLPRPMDELRGFSADTFSYLCGTDEMWLYRGGFTTYTKAEGHLFPGIVPVVMALAGLFCLAVALRRRTVGAAPTRGWRLALAACASLIGVAAIEFARFELFAGRRIWRVREAWPWLSDIRHVFFVIAACAAILIAVSPRARAAARLALRSGRVFFAALFFFSVWMSFGPLVTTLEHGIAADTLYGWFYRNVPGFNGLRVPARYGMLAMLFLAVLGGYGAAAMQIRVVAAVPGRAGRLGRLPSYVVLPLVALLFLLETASMPVGTRRIEWARHDGRPGTVSAAELQPVYAFIRKLPPGTVVAEFPFGGLHNEVRAVYLTIRHGHPIVNGYSGGAPPSYGAHIALIADPLATGEPAWQAILDSGATCLVVHEWAFEGGVGKAFSDWLEAHGALPLATFRSDRLFQVPR